MDYKYELENGGAREYNEILKDKRVAAEDYYVVWVKTRRCEKLGVVSGGEYTNAKSKMSEDQRGRNCEVFYNQAFR